MNEKNWIYVEKYGLKNNQYTMSPNGRACFQNSKEKMGQLGSKFIFINSNARFIKTYIFQWGIIESHSWFRK
jgi:hypothetical protein